VSESKSQVKPFEISKAMVWEAYRRVKANKGSAGVDGVTIEQYEQDLKNNPVQTVESPVVGELLPTAGQSRADTKGWGQRGQNSRGAHCGRSDRPDDGSHVFGAGGGTHLPPRLLWLPSGPFCFGCSGEIPGALLEERLGG
jgi:hypothetical protein